MKSTQLALVFPLGDHHKNDNAARISVWSEAVAILQPLLGKVCSRFEPSVRAWKQDINQPFGVVLGRSEPAQFLYFYATGKHVQNEAMRFHLSGFLDQLEPVGENGEDSGIYAVQITPGKNDALAAHLFWHISAMAGEVLPDLGIYFVKEKQAVVSDETDKEILSHIERYAICMVTLAGGSGNA